jgi:prefoldin subunit 4
MCPSPSFCLLSKKPPEVSHSQLSKEEEAATEEVQVRREDQEKINKFSKLHQRHAMLEDELKQKQAGV